MCLIIFKIIDDIGHGRTSSCYKSLSVEKRDMILQPIVQGAES